MIRRWQKLLNFLHKLSDFCLIICSYFTAAYIWLILIRKNPVNIAIQWPHAVWFSLSYAALCVFSYYAAGLYKSLRVKKWYYDVGRILIINAAAVMFGAVMMYILHFSDFSRGVLMLFYFISSIAIDAKRLVMRGLLNYFRTSGKNLKHVIIVGSGSIAREYAETVQRHPRYGYAIDGYLGPEPDIPDIPYLGTWEKAGKACLARPGIDEVVAALEREHITILPEILEATDKGGVKVSYIPYFSGYISASTTIEVMGGCKMLNLRATPLDFPAYALFKRVFDLAGALILLALSAPFMLAAAIGVRLSSPGPVIFKQTRVGKNKELFKMYKFRSMCVNDEADTAWTGKDDPRKTRFGSFLRKTSIDELPQLVNVLKGDMSLIGPRPEIPRFVERFRETVPRYMLKHIVKPGITGWAQVNGYRGDTSIDERIRLDIWYIENWTFWLDIRICLRTIFGGMINKEIVH
jgi:Undecaprenyl-phosphate glucose phosphotransferase